MDALTVFLNFITNIKNNSSSDNENELANDLLEQCKDVLNSSIINLLTACKRASMSISAVKDIIESLQHTSKYSEELLSEILRN